MENKMIQDDTTITISKSQFDNISLTSCNITIFTSLAGLFFAITLATGFVLGDVLLASLFATLATFNARRRHKIVYNIFGSDNSADYKEMFAKGLGGKRNAK